jgi:hypothetical protein
VIHQQPLIVPLYIEASASEELIIIENILTFQANGFNIKIDPDACPGKKVQLLAVPFSKHIQFGQVFLHIHIHIYIYIYMYMYIYIGVCVFVFINMYIYVCSICIYVLPPVRINRPR